MIQRIEVALKPGFTDAAGEGVVSGIKSNLGIEIESCKTVDVFTVSGPIEEAQLKKILFAFYDKIIQDVSLSPIAQAKDFNYLVEVGFLPGVTDNIGNTSREAIEYALGKKFGKELSVHSSRQYLIKGDLSSEQIESIAKNYLANQLIERFEIFSTEDWEKGKQIKASIPKVKEDFEIKVDEVNLDVSDDELVNISREGTLALNLDEMRAVRDYFKQPEILVERKKQGLGEKPTDVELEVLAQTWSEHCKHKIFNATINYKEGDKKEQIKSIFKTFIRGSTEKIGEEKDFLVSVFHDNAGIIKFTDDWNLSFKAETHNSPSALDPYGGALTGIVGVNRDALGTGKGSRLIFNTDVFCFADPFYSGNLPEGMLHPRRIFEGVRKGVQDGGNKSGIPTVNGTIVFDDRYRGKPLVYCGTGGLLPAKINGEPTEEKTAKPGDAIVMVGGRIGKDGIHGATFSSEELHEGSPATAVQIGDPITQKKMVDCILEARDECFYNNITDNGAGGLSSSIGEMARSSNGFELHLDKVPLKYAGLQPWEIMLSEAQERMTLAVPQDSVDDFMALCKKHDVEATVLGKFTDSGMFHVFFEGRAVAFMTMDFVHDGLPEMILEAEWSPEEKAGAEEKIFSTDFSGDLKKLLASLNICSKHYVVRQYDHEVQCSSIVKPLTGAMNDGPSDAGVIKPIYDSWEGIAVSNGICPRYSDIDTYHMTANAIDEAIRNAVAVGADPDYVALLDNFCWPDPEVDEEKNPDGKHKLAQLVRANKALSDYALAFSAPFISGKDSMKCDFRMGGEKISVPPTLLVSAVAKLPDVRKAVTMDVKCKGDLVYVLGETKNELGGSEFLALSGKIGKNVPVVDAEKALKLYRALHSAIKKELVASCHDLSDGGLAVALAETAFSGELGLEADLSTLSKEDGMDNTQILFSESASRFVVSVSEKNKEAFEKELAGNSFAVVGKVNDSNALLVKGIDGNQIINEKISELKNSWKKTLDW